MQGLDSYKLGNPFDEEDENNTICFRCEYEVEEIGDELCNSCGDEIENNN